MKTRDISYDNAIELCGKNEDHVYDRKALGVKGQKVQKIAVAFANSDGGEFVIGIADDKDEPSKDKRWNGADKKEIFNSHLQALFEVQPSLDINYEFLTCKPMHGYVLRVMVEKSSEVCKTADNKVYQRIGAQCLPITDPQRILELSFAKGSSSYEDYSINNLHLEDIINSKELIEFLASYSPKMDPSDFITNQHLINRKTKIPCVAGILLFCDNPSVCLPKKCAVKIARYETKDGEPERSQLKEQHTIEGPLFKVIHETVDMVISIMSSIQIWTTEGLDFVTYPLEAIWEVIVNAIIHRDYSISDDVYVYIYNNRIEVFSPGKLPGYITVDNILEARYSRNPKIVRTLSRYKDAPNKDLGEGLNTAFQKMKEWRLKAPIIREVGNYVRVILPHTPLAKPTEAILEFLEHNMTITNRQARDITGLHSENHVKLEFYKLRDAGLIERVPGLNGSASAWQRTNRPVQVLSDEQYRLDL